ncbi:hypothetical protein [Cellulosimicrobium cellulans]|uniref:hypothetical protein n=1 Tax=Cellulosimicrobium cellulans TaxID=1710 RepID=UPI0002D5D4EE|nr:hypothetical protein [Cellulosimicrobium cellulans]
MTSSTTASAAAFRERLRAMIVEPARAQVLLLLASDLPQASPVGTGVRQQVRPHLAAYLRAVAAGDPQ